MTDITIPPEVLEKVAAAIFGLGGLSGEMRDVHLHTARAACLAMLKAWPGVFFYKYGDDGSEAIILPLPKEPEA